MTVNRGTFLFLSLFILVFAPKVVGGIDLIAAYSVVLIALASHSGTLRALPRTTRIPATRYLFVLFALIAWAVFSAGMHEFQELYQPLRFMKCVLHFAGCYALMAFYYQFYGDRAATRMIEHFWFVLLAHAAIMLIMFTFPVLNQLYAEHILAVDPGDRRYEARMSGNRIGGLTSSWDAISGVQSLGLLLIPILLALPKGKIPHWMVVAAIPLLLFSVAISGTTGVFTFAAFAVVTILLLGVKHWTSHAGIMCAAALVCVVIGSAFTSYWKDGDFSSTSIARTAYMISDSIGIGNVEFSDQNRTASATDAVASIFEKMYFLPQELSIWLAGHGGSGRSSWNYVVESDPGVTLNLHNLGLAGFLLIYVSFFMQMRFVVGNLKRHGPLWVALLVIPMVLFMIDTKVQYLYSRNSFTIMAIAFLVSWAEYRPAPQRARSFQVSGPSRAGNRRRVSLR